MTEYEEIESVKKYILSVKSPAYFTTNKKELRIRCPYCGDSKADKSHAHLYVQMKPPFQFYCQKCTTKGVLCSETLRDMQIYNSDVVVSLVNLSKNNKADFENNTFRRAKKLINHPASTELSYRTLNYFNRRFNRNFTELDLIEKYKAVMDPIIFLAENNIYVENGQYDFNNAIGFISSDGSHVVFRDISCMQQKRYYNLSLVPDDCFSTSKIYNIKSILDSTKLNTTLIIAEGIFDIIGIELFLKDNNMIDADSQYIFSAACGKGYNSVISNYIHKGFFNLECKIFSDSDVDLNFYRNLKNSSVYIKRSRLEVFYNTLSKDYGIPSDGISLKKIIV